VSRAERIQQEARSLWIETFGEAPDPHYDGPQLLDLLMRRTQAQTYTRLRAASRASNLAWPRKR